MREHHNAHINLWNKIDQWTLNPSDSDDDSDNTINENSNAIKTAEKIKQQQEQNNALVSLNNQVNIW